MERREIGNAVLYRGDCREILPTLPLSDAAITDSPYGLGFMGRGWDHDVPDVQYWEIMLNALKPGAHLLAFGGTRTFHRLMVAIEDAGFEIRDTIMWVYGTGFPKSHNVSKAIDKTLGEEPIDVGQSPNWRDSKRDREKNGQMEVRGENAGRVTIPATDEAKQWEGWGTALKPAWEPIIVARKPFKGAVAANVLEHGTGALNIADSRVATEDDLNGGGYTPRANGNAWEETGGMNAAGRSADGPFIQPEGRWPANLIHDGDNEIIDLFPQTKNKNAARFYYCPKANKSDRGEGNTHPTVKPTALMRYLCRLVTPPGGTVVDGFMGTASTGKGALLEGFKFVGIDNDEEKGSFETACQRINDVQKQAELFHREPA